MRSMATGSAMYGCITAALPVMGIGMPSTWVYMHLVWILPDLGYPEYTGEDPKRLQWISNTISHNTVVVDRANKMLYG